MKASALNCLKCERRPAVQCYDGVIPMAVLCDHCRRAYGLTAVIPNATPQSVSTPATGA